MGRAKRKMEVTSNERGRRLAFERRKKGLLKKAYELSTLCDIGVCVIIYSPKQDIDDPMGMEVETWPTNHNEVHDMIESYKKRPDQDDSTKTVDLPSFFKDKKKKLEEELMKLRAKNKNENEAKFYPTWDDRYDALPEEDFRELNRVMESKIEAVEIRLEFMKGTPVPVPVAVAVAVPAGNMVDCTQKQCSYSMQDLFGRNSMQLEVPLQYYPNQYPHHQQSISDFDVPFQYYPLDQTQKGGGIIPVDNYPNSIANPMILNHSYCTDQLGSASSSKVVYTPRDGAINVDPVDGGGMLDNIDHGEQSEAGLVVASFDSEMWH